MSTQSNGASTALATVGTVCWCIQLIPQVIRNWYVRDCEGVPPVMFFLFAISGIPFAIYFVVQFAEIAFMVQPHIFATFSFVAFWQSLYYPPVSYSIKKSTLILGLVVGICIGVEVGCIIPLRHLYSKGIEWPNLIPGIVASVLLAAGLLPPYWELIKRQGRVVGINFLFLALDSTGALTSMIGVIVQTGKLDVLGLVLYAIVLAMEYGILLSHFCWMFRVRLYNSKVEPTEETQKWNTRKLEVSNPPHTQKLRNWVTDKLVLPVTLKLTATKDKVTSTAAPLEGL